MLSGKACRARSGAEALDAVVGWFSAPGVEVLVGFAYFPILGQYMKESTKCPVGVAVRLISVRVEKDFHAKSAV